MEETFTLEPDQLAKIQKADAANLVKRVGEGKPLTGPQWARLRQAGISTKKIAPSTARNVNELCEILDFRRQQYSRWRTLAGAPTKSAKGLYDVEAWRSFLKREGLAKDTPEESSEKQELELERLRIQCSELAMTRDERRGELVRVDDVTRYIEEQFGGLKKKLLALPASIAPRLVRMKKTQTVARELKRAITDLLRSVADYDPDR